MARLKWTIARRKMVERWVSEAQPKLALADWTIHFLWEGNEFTHPLEGPCEAFATMTPFPSSKHAELSLSLDFLHLPPAMQTQVLVHELVHCHLFSLHEYARDGFAAVPGRGKTVQKFFETGLTQQVELATDGLADAFSALVPRLRLP